MKILKTILILLICAIPLLAQNGDVVITINGHEHQLDLILKEVRPMYASD